MYEKRGWSGGAAPGKLPVPGRPTNLDKSRARAYCACSRCGWGLFEHFVSRLSFLFSSPPLSLGDGPIKTEIVSQRAVKAKTTNQPTMYEIRNYTSTNANGADGNKHSSSCGKHIHTKSDNLY